MRKVQGRGARAASVKSSRVATVATVAVVVLAADLLTQQWARTQLISHPVHVIGPVNFVFVLNSGFAFSLLRGHPLLVALIEIVLSVAVAALAYRTRYSGTAVAAALVLGGAVGNLADRVVFPYGGAVVDFISLPHWPVFNVSDIGVTLGVALLILAGIRDRL